MGSGAPSAGSAAWTMAVPTTAAAQEALDGGGSGLPPLHLPASAAAIRSSVWLRLGLLMPLLPIVHADRETDARRGLKAQLVTALAWLLLSPVSQPLAAIGSSAAGADGTDHRPAKGSDPDLSDLGFASSAVAGETLQDRLAAVLSTLLAGMPLFPTLLSKGTA